MKKRSGGLSRILKIGMFLGLIGLAGLCWMGYQKANEAEANTTAIEGLGNIHLHDETATTTTETIENFLIELFGDSAIVKDAIAALGDDTVAEIITVHYYLPDDDTVSTAIGQKILTHRLNRTYSQAELASIYCDMMGYSATTEITPAEKESFLQNILDELAEQGIILNDTNSGLETTN